MFYVDDQAAVLVRHVDVINVDDDVAVQVHGDGEGLWGSYVPSLMRVWSEDCAALQRCPQLKAGGLDIFKRLFDKKGTHLGEKIIFYKSHDDLISNLPRMFWEPIRWVRGPTSPIMISFSDVKVVGNR